MYALQLFQMQCFAFFVIVNLPNFFLNLLGCSGDNLSFLILCLSILVELAFGFFFSFSYLYIFYRNDFNKPSGPITSSDVPPSSSDKTCFLSLSAKFKWCILLESLK